MCRIEKIRVLRCESRWGASSIVSDLLGLAPGSDNNCDNYTVRPIITPLARRDADGRVITKRPSSHFHEMSYQIMAGCDIYIYIVYIYRRRKEFAAYRRYTRPRLLRDARRHNAAAQEINVVKYRLSRSLLAPHFDRIARHLEMPDTLSRTFLLVYTLVFHMHFGY